MRRRLALFAVLAFIAVFLALPRDALATEQVVSFNASYDIDKSGLVRATEDITYDFGSTEHHGIFRYMPVRYDFDSEHDRKIDVTGITVTDDAGTSQPYEITDTDPNLVLKIGDPDVTVTGVHRYKISYVLNGALNPFPDHDEFYWNVTGDDWEAPIDSVTVLVKAPTGENALGSVQQVDCFQGEAGSKAKCKTSEISSGNFGSAPEGLIREAGPQALFESRGTLSPGEGMTIVVGLKKGAVTVGPPVLVDKVHEKTIGDYFKITPITVGLMIAGILAAIVVVLRAWWVQGRDRWLGDMFYLNEVPSTPSSEAVKPLMAHETVVVEFTPPELDGESKRPLRPAEIGILLDERADTLDVTATIVDLAVRKHLIIKEESSGGVFGLFKHKDYELDRLEPETNDLLPYEQQLKEAFFESGETVKLSDLKNKFHDDLAEVKSTLYKQALADKFFPYNPDTVRNIVRGAGIAAIVIGGLAMYGFGWLFGGALLGIPIVFAGVLLLLFANAFPRRTATGRVLYRRSLGFRRFMAESDKERQKFAERANIFHEYLPYAIVYGCVDKWANAFKDLGIEVGQPGYYIGTGPFIASSFASNMSSFSSSIGSTMASTPGGSGGSGFGGGSGGGGGGGGGGSW